MKHKDLKPEEAVFILVGVDVLFNDGKLSNKLINCFYDILKAHFDSKKPVTYVLSQKDLVDAGFGC